MVSIYCVVATVILTCQMNFPKSLVEGKPYRPYTPMSPYIVPIAWNWDRDDFSNNPYEYWVAPSRRTFTLEWQRSLGEQPTPEPEVEEIEDPDKKTITAVCTLLKGYANYMMHENLPEEWSETINDACNLQKPSAEDKAAFEKYVKAVEEYKALVEEHLNLCADAVQNRQPEDTHEMYELCELEL